MGFAQYFPVDLCMGWELRDGERSEEKPPVRNGPSEKTWAHPFLVALLEFVTFLGRVNLSLLIYNRGGSRCAGPGMHVEISRS